MQNSNNDKETPNKQLISKKTATITHNITQTKPPFSASDSHPEFDEAVFYAVLAFGGIAVISFLSGMYSNEVPVELSEETYNGIPKDTSSTIWKAIKTVLKKIF